MTTTFYDKVLAHAKTMSYGEDINIRNIFKNYRKNKGLSLTRFGMFVLTDMGIESETFKLLNEVKFTAQLRILLDRYNKYPYYISKHTLVLFGDEDRILYKLYGHDLDAWVEHMKENIKKD
jgi:hypothetical protein